MVKQLDNVRNEETLYDTVIVGAGIAGLTAAYMLRDKNILLIEKEDRFGGRVWSEKINEATYNIGTQYLNEEDNSFIHLVDELGVERITHDVTTAASIVLYLNNQLYLKPSSLLNWRTVLDGVRFLSNTYRKSKIFRLPPDDPRRPKLITRVSSNGMINNPIIKISVGEISKVPCDDLFSRSRFNMAHLLVHQHQRILREQCQPHLLPNRIIR